jgi:hypothetical protein
MPWFDDLCHICRRVSRTLRWNLTRSLNCLSVGTENPIHCDVDLGDMDCDLVHYRDDVRLDLCAEVVIP